MELIQQRISLVVLSWSAWAMLGIGISMLTQLLLWYNLKKKDRWNIPEVTRMIKHNIFAELIRFAAYAAAVILIGLYIFGVIGADALGWLLVTMLALFVLNSINEFITILRLMYDK